MRTAILSIVVLLACCTAHAATLEVAADGTADYETIGAALTGAEVGDVVALAAGTYSPSTNGEVFPLVVPAGVTLEGAGLELSVIDGEYTEGLITTSWSEGNAVALRDLTLTGGEAPFDSDADALYLWQAEAVVERVAFEANGDPSIPDMPWNVDSWIDLRSSSLQLVDVTLQGNHGSNRGIRCQGSDMTLTRVGFLTNYVYYSLLDLRDDCTGAIQDVHVLDNSGSNCDEALFAVGEAAAANLEIAGNDVGPCRLWTGAELVHATVADNRAHGLFPLIEVTRLGHSIVAFNDGPIALAEGGEAVFNDVYGNEPADWEGEDPSGTEGNRSEDPLFAALGNGERDLRLADDSPLLDAGGDRLTWPTDIDGAARPIDGDGDGAALPDPGAYEHPTVVPGDDDDSAMPGDDDTASPDDDSADTDDDVADEDGCRCHSVCRPAPGAAALLGALALAALIRRRP